MRAWDNEIQLRFAIHNFTLHMPLANCYKLLIYLYVDPYLLKDLINLRVPQVKKCLLVLKCCFFGFWHDYFFCFL